MNRQVTHVNLVPAYENASGIFPFQGTVDTDFRYKAWNVMMEWVPEFFGSPTDEALSGKKRNNFRGYRMKATISLDNTTQASGIRLLFNRLSGGFDRIVWQTQSNTTDVGTNTVQLKSPAPSVNAQLVGTTASGFVSPVTSLVTAYTAGTTTITTEDFVETNNNDPLTFYIKPNFETIVLFDPLGTSTTYSGVNMIACNPVSNNYGVSRESTINKQRIGLELESVELFKDIPSQFVIT